MTDESHKGTREQPVETEHSESLPKVGDQCGACGTKLGSWYAKSGNCDWCGWNPATGQLPGLTPASSEEPDFPGLYPAIGGCMCLCHEVPGIVHFFPCCGAGSVNV